MDIFSQISFALILINLIVIVLFYVLMTQHSKKFLNADRKHLAESLNTTHSWWAVASVFFVGFMVGKLDMTEAWIALLMLPMVNLAIFGILHALNHRWAHLREFHARRTSPARA